MPDVCYTGWFAVSQGGMGLFKTVAKTVAAMNLAHVDFNEPTQSQSPWPRPGQWSGPGQLEAGEQLIGVRFCGTAAGWGDPADALPALIDDVKSYAHPYENCAPTT